MEYCAMPDNIGDKTYCTPWNQKVLTYDFQNYSSLGKEKTLNEIENAFSFLPKCLQFEIWKSF